SNAKLARPLLAAALRAPCAEHVIGIEPLRQAQSGTLTFHDWDALLAGDAAAARAAVEARIAGIGRADTACIIYTSGTGGAPRGVMQHHGAILHNAAGAAEVLVNDFGIGDEEVFLSFLPLSHAYEHSGGQFLPIMVGAQIYYSEGLEKLVSNIEETKPTIMVVVPRLFEVIRARMIKSVEKQGKLANWMLSQALRVGEKDYERRLGVLDRPVDLILNKLFRPKIQQRFGGRMKALV
ncbi:AMP-binding protein, partial [Novosphingobium sp. UBA1939]|uniref:AMP-binding protein n=1 Tax=Novosphingobium sp. UBA1939 TaxID=1946982 RepID=UPI0025FF21FB